MLKNVGFILLLAFLGSCKKADDPAKQSPSSFSYNDIQIPVDNMFVTTFLGFSGNSTYPKYYVWTSQSFGNYKRYRLFIKTLNRFPDSGKSLVLIGNDDSLDQETATLKIIKTQGNAISMLTDTLYHSANGGTVAFNLKGEYYDIGFSNITLTGAAFDVSLNPTEKYEKTIITSGKVRINAYSNGFMLVKN